MYVSMYIYIAVHHGRYRRKVSARTVKREFRMTPAKKSKKGPKTGTCNKRAYYLLGLGNITTLLHEINVT